MDVDFLILKFMDFRLRKKEKINLGFHHFGEPIHKTSRVGNKYSYRKAYFMGKGQFRIKRLAYTNPATHKPYYTKNKKYNNLGHVKALYILEYILETWDNNPQIPKGTEMHFFASKSIDKTVSDLMCQNAYTHYDLHKIVWTFKKIPTIKSPNRTEGVKGVEIHYVKNSLPRFPEVDYSGIEEALLVLTSEWNVEKQWNLARELKSNLIPLLDGPPTKREYIKIFRKRLKCSYSVANKLYETRWDVGLP